MKYLLLICLLYTVLSIRITRVTQDDKVPLKDLELVEVDETFKKAVELDNPKADIDSLKLLKVYKDTDKKNSYRMRFVDKSNKLNVVQEYVITDPSTPPEKKTYKPKRGFKVKQSLRTKIGNVMPKHINSNDISNIDLIETPLDYVYMVSTNSQDKKQTYVVSQNRKNLQELESLGALN